MRDISYIAKGDASWEKESGSVAKLGASKYRLYNEDEGLSNIHDRGRSPRTCIFDDPESELYNRLVPECGGVSVSYWFIQSCPM